MHKNRFLMVIGVVSLLLVTMAVSSPRSHGSSTTDRMPSGSYQQHPEWWWRTTNQNVVLPITGSSDAFPDYYQRHPELSVSPILGLEASDYFQRHPELTVRSAGTSVDLTDYYFRHG